MKLSASLLLAVNSAKAAETNCCQHVRIEATDTGLASLDNSGTVLKVSHWRSLVLKTEPIRQI